MVENLNVAGYCRISVDEEIDRDNTSIENQKMIIKDYVERFFAGSKLSFFVDRDKSGYTFEERNGYQEMRTLMLAGKINILVVKDFSRFSRRNGEGLVELEGLRDVGIRIISIGDGVDYPTYDDWMQIQFRFLVNEMPVTDASRKVKSVIKRRQELGKWICSVPYGYVITNNKTMEFEIEPSEALIVQEIFELYKEGWGYKKIANYLTDKHYPTPRMSERARKEAKGEVCKFKVRPEWSIVTVQGILSNDFYIGTLRQGKYTRKKINGADIKKDVNEHIVFENNHSPIIDYRTFALVQDALKKRTKTHYRGIKKYDNVYSGMMVCGDCGSPMFPMSRKDLKEAYRCGAYHQRGLKGCTSHHIRVDVLNDAVRAYLQKVRDVSSDMIAKLRKAVEGENSAIENNQETIDMLEKQLENAVEEKKMYIKQCAREIMRRPEKEDSIQETYDELIEETEQRIEGIKNQILLTYDKRNTIIKVNRASKEVINVFDEIIRKVSFDKGDIELIIEKIYIYDDNIQIQLKDDIECILKSGTLSEGEQAVNFNSGIIDSLNIRLVQISPKHLDKVYDVSVINSGDPLEIFTDREGEVIFKKYSPIGELAAFASQYAETLYKTCQMAIVICDRDAVVASAGVIKKDYNDRKITPEFEKIMEDRVFFCAAKDGSSIRIVDTADGVVSCAMPIISDGDVTGAVASVIMEGNSKEYSPEIEEKLIQTAALFLGKQLES